MEYELRIQQLEEEIKKLKEKIEFEMCPLCFGSGEISTPSRENYRTCWRCNGSGKIKKL